MKKRLYKSKERLSFLSGADYENPNGAGFSATVKDRRVEILERLCASSPRFFFF